MNEKNQSIYDNHLGQGQYNAAQQIAKRCFNTYLLQLAGLKFLLHKLIQLPILAQCSAEQPASAQMQVSLMNYINDLQEHKQTPEYQAAVERSGVADAIRVADGRGGGR